MPSKGSAISTGIKRGFTHDDFNRSTSAATASRLRLNASQRASSTIPNWRPISVRRKSALSSRRLSRYSAREVNMR
ncbi:hypothetical protein D3C71_2041230 [compost metagenome]